MRPRRIGLVAVVLVTVVLVVLGASRTTDVAFTTAVAPDVPMVTIRRGGTACQDVARVRARFDRVALPLDDGRLANVTRAPGVVQIRDPTTGAVLASGPLRADWPEFPVYARVRLNRSVATDRHVVVCVLDRGRGPIAVFGTGADRFPGAPATVARGTTGGGRLTLRFERDRRTRLAELGEVVDRLALLRATWVGPWLGWALIVLVVLGVPAALVLALRRAEP